MPINLLNNNFASNSTLNRILELNQSKEDFIYMGSSLIDDESLSN